MNPLKYLMKELSLKATDWSTLSDIDKNDLKDWARVEMKVLGIEFTN